MTPQELKASILQLAIQGKLVEQRPEEGTGEELFQQIRAEKQRLIKAGTIKKGKPIPEIAEDEIPFDIPENWCWGHLDDVVVKPIKRGKSPTYAAKSNTLVFAQKCNTKAGYIDLSLALCLDESKLSKYPDEEFMRDSDIVINSTGNGTLGRVGIYRNSDNPGNSPLVPDSHVTVIRASKTVSVEYTYYVLKYYKPFMEKLGTGSTNQTELSASVVRALLFPIPPFAEQKRIVAKIEELLPLIDRYEKAWSKLEDFNKRFPVDMQKSILQMAIQGKLVDQRPEEGTGEELYQQIQAEKQRLIKAGTIKKEKPLPEIAEEEIPFDIPDSWKWIRLSDVGQLKNGYSFKSTEYTATGIQVVRISDLGEDAILSTDAVYYPFRDELSQYVIENNSFLICMTGSIGKMAWVKDGGLRYLNQRVGMFVPNPMCCCAYLWHFLHTAHVINGWIRAKTSTNGNIKTSDITELVVPLPPLAEQKRIVAKLEEILPLCDHLK